MQGVNMFLLQVAVFCFTLMAATLNGMHLSEELIQIHQEEKYERATIRQSDQKLQAYPQPAWTHEEDKAYSIRLAELEERLTQFEKEWENRQATSSSTHEKMTKEELRAKLKREEEELTARREQKKEKVQHSLIESIADLST
jgi:DNA-binding protein Fis